MTERRSAYRTKPAAKPDYSADLLLQLKAVGITGFEREVRFHPLRKWKFDLADWNSMVALEIEGGVKGTR